ncbi:negative elongation factor complex member b [Anaeramoeba flamelloides]|uniref:Negative elongation factor complex member b n=1 Tax=Anaeramoeba flamelloides TaxID=1746091 RepID=A0AAV7Y8M8_9EUKA|nr:negative elongation factor complex member b [Anaeramoeba flamelloides]
MDPPQFKIGLIGSKEISEKLRKEEPGKAILNFQKSHSLKEKKSDPALQLLSLHGFSYLETHKSLFNLMKNDLISKIPNLSQEKLDVLLEKTFKYIGIEELQSIPIKAMQSQKKIPKKFLRELESNKELAEKCPFEIKRQIWEINTLSFHNEVYPLLQSFILDTSQRDLRLDMMSSELRPSKRREANPVLQKLLTLIGTSLPLYQSTIEVVRLFYSKTGDIGLCTLRSELVMAIHDLQITELINNEECHDLAWIFDACIKDGLISTKRIKNLENLFHTKSLLNNQSLEDVAMLIRDPFATWTLTRSVYAQIEYLVENSILPSNDENLKGLTFLLQLGFVAREVVKTKKYHIPPEDSGLLKNFYPLIVHLILSDQQESEINVSDYSDLIATFTKSNKIARSIAEYYIVLKMSSKIYNMDFPKIFTQKLLQLQENLVDELPFVYSIVNKMITLKSISQDLWTVFVDEFLVKIAKFSIPLHAQCIKLFTKAKAPIVKMSINSAKLIVEDKSVLDVANRDKSEIQNLKNLYTQFQELLLNSQTDSSFLDPLIMQF